MTKIYDVGQIYRLTSKWSDAYTNRSLTAAYGCLQEGEFFEVLEVCPHNQKVTKAKHKSTGTVITHDMLFASSDLSEHRLELVETKPEGNSHCFGKGQLYYIDTRWLDTSANRQIALKFPELKNGALYEVIECEDHFVTKARNLHTGQFATARPLFNGEDALNGRIKLYIAGIDSIVEQAVDPDFTCLAKAPSTDVAINASKELQTIALEQDGKIITLAGVQITQLKSILDRMVEK